MNIAAVKSGHVVRPGQRLRPWVIVRRTVDDFLDDQAMTLAAALAFYTTLSLAPILLLLLWVAGFVGGHAKKEISQQVEAVVGAAAGEAVSQVIENAQERPDLRTQAGLLSILTALAAATGVFAHLQYTMNLVWEVPPGQKSGLFGWLRKRLLSLLMILVAGVLLIASLVLGTAVSMAKSMGGEWVSWLGPLATVPEILVSLLVFTGFFAAIYKFLPDVHIHWRAVLGGALVTAILFMVGRWLVALYLAHSSTGSAYGAAGSLLVLLTWIYYSSVIFLFGAELTHVWGEKKGLIAELPTARSRGSQNADWK